MRITDSFCILIDVEKFEAQLGMVALRAVIRRKRQHQRAWLLIRIALSTLLIIALYCYVS